MGRPKRRFVGKAEAEKGGRILDNKQKKWWGERCQNFPEDLLKEPNGEKRSEQVTALLRKTTRKRL